MNVLGEILAQIVKDCIREGLPVELDGLGVFGGSEGEPLGFAAEQSPCVFIAYVVEDVESALEVTNALEAAGMKVWIDRRKLLPGQKWRRCIERAIQRADFFVALFSRKSTRKRGQFPCELRYALRCAERLPLGDTFVVPIRLDDCPVPQAITSHVQYVDLFPDKPAGMARVITAIQREFQARRQRDAV